MRHFIRSKKTTLDDYEEVKCARSSCSNDIFNPSSPLWDFLLASSEEAKRRLKLSSQFCFMLEGANVRRGREIYGGRRQAGGQGENDRSRVASVRVRILSVFLS